MKFFIGIIIAVYLQPYKAASDSVPASTAPAFWPPICNYKTPCYLKCDNDDACARFGRPESCHKIPEDCGCKKYYDPVCGTDDKNYDNICLLRCASIKSERLGGGRIVLAYGGPCACDCSRCDDEYRPVCGSDCRTYWNQCWLNCYSRCNQRRRLPKVTPVKIGYC